MSIISGKQLAKYFGAQDVFADITFDIARGEKIGLVGPNGAGKTTLLRIILGLEEPSAGNVTRARGLRLGYLPQNPTFSSQQTLYREMLSAFDALRKQQRALMALASEMAGAEDSSELMEQYARAEQAFDLAGGYEYENHIRRVLGGLGFDSTTYAWPISILSGGQVTRALLAKLLLQEPELLVLDEPTNYLDLEALEWLEAYLQEWPQSLLVVSHDRYFLDRVATRIWEMDRQSLEIYRGNYSHYVEQREGRRLRKMREYEAQQDLIAKTEDFIRRYGAGQRSKEARGRETRLRRMELVDRPQEKKQMHLRLATALRSGDNVLMSDGAKIGYAAKLECLTTDGPKIKEHVLFDTGEFLILRGQCVALLGPNGCGKTSFIRTLLGDIPPLDGRIRLGASVRIGYLPQNQGWLAESKTVLEHITDMGLLPDEARNLLGRFLFSGDDVFKMVSTLSGGERARLGLAILTLRGANFLILDEPTTHLDVESQEILQDVLADFNGTILFVTHDRYLIDALATHVWVVDGGRMRQFEGNYSKYMQVMAQEKAAVAGAPKESSAAKPGEEERRLERRKEREIRQRAQHVEQLEADITELEQGLERVTAMIDRASARQDLGSVHSLGAEYQQLQAALAERLQEWEQMMGTLSGEAT